MKSVSAFRASLKSRLRLPAGWTPRQARATGTVFLADRASNPAL